ncbi:hypothetical protein, secreted [gut metagenome]|uniref:Lipoprotein n=1 Tax=gut metagenome TaxID=749906 RepID=J9FKW7_9ZZZZ
MNKLFKTHKRMKTNDWKFSTLALIACFGLSTTFTACSDDDDPVVPGPGTDPQPEVESEIVLEDGATLNGTIANGKTVVLKQGRQFRLNGEYIVEEGGLLKIEPGVKVTAVTDDTPDYFLVKQGGKMEAIGTAEQPIVMTAEEGEDWGGIHLCGRAHTNKNGALSEIGNAPYGGNQEDDNSGTLQYVRLEYTGFALDPEHESNGISLYGVGSGTTLDHICIYKGKDDGIEFFGGSANVKYAVVIDAEDDSFDWTEGWNGKAQFLVASQLGTSGAKDQGDCLMECDNNGDNFVAAPVAHPILSNLTLIGNNSAEGKRGIRLRAGTEVEIYNTLVAGKPQCVTVETKETETALSEGRSKLQYITCTGAFNSKENIFTADAFTAADNHNQVNNALNFTDTFVGTLPSAFNPQTLGDFFENAPYQGAVSADNNWAQGAWMRI